MVEQGSLLWAALPMWLDVSAQEGVIAGYSLCHYCWHLISAGTIELPLLKQAPTALVKSKPFQTDQFPLRKCSFPIKPESNYLGLALDQKGLLPVLFPSPSGLPEL